METFKNKTTKTVNNIANKGKDFVESVADKISHYVKNPEALNNLLDQAFKKASIEESANTNLQRIGSIFKNFFTMIREAIKGEYRHIATGKIILGIAALIYIVLPKDVLPERLPFIGMLDDVAVLAWFIKTADEELKKYNEWKATNVATV